MDGVDDEFLTVAEIAERLKLNQQTLRNWIEQGQLPAIRIGRRVRIRRSDFERLVEEGYSGRARESPAQPEGPSAEDFWSGEAIGIAHPPRPHNDEPEDEA
ncbi:MAG: helix-turn-helix domain-containing protein [Solirubrobacterales bacterium]|nr:helix-turn-helix domain-containing protein [Solirubrobacterales bacterium]